MVNAYLLNGSMVGVAIKVENKRCSEHVQNFKLLIVYCSIVFFRSKFPDQKQPYKERTDKWTRVTLTSVA